MNCDANDRENLLAVNLGLWANVLLAVMKTTVGIVGHSPALLADGINSTSDVVYSAIVRVFMLMAGKPPDREHPYGHRQLENIAAVVVGAFVIATAVAIFFNAASNVYDLLSGVKDSTAAGPVTLWVALFTVVLKVFLTVYTKRIGRHTGSIAVLAMARDHRNDVFSIATATIGILFSRAGYIWVDPAAAAMVALVILYTGIEIIRESSAEVMNILPSKLVSSRIRQLVQSVPGVEHLEEIHIHRIGPYLLVNVTIGIDGTLTVADGDLIASRVEDTLWQSVEYLRRVSVHYHPSKRQRCVDDG